MAKKRAPLSTCKAGHDQAVSLPTSLAKAMKVDFGVPITAYISAAAYGAGDMYLEGVVFGDRAARFDDGDTIRTSIIMNSETIGGFLVVQTLSSIYVVCDFLGGRFSDTSIASH